MRPWVVVAMPLLLLANVTAVGAVAQPTTGAPIAQQGTRGDAVALVQAALDYLAGYEYGDSREPLEALRLLVRASPESPEAGPQIEERMIAFLQSDATFAGKQFVCEQLSIVGSSAAVPALTRLLLEEETTDIALYALQRIPDPAVGAALRDSLRTAGSATRVAIVNALGERGDGAAVADLAAQLSDPDPAIARAAATALGKIADAEATAVLDAARATTSGAVRGAVLDAYLRGADRLVAEGNNARAASIYRDLYDNEDATNIRAAALRGLARADEASAAEIVVAALRQDNPKLQAVAAGLVRELPDTVDVQAVIAEIPSLSPTAQIQLLSAFAERGEEAAYPEAIAATGHDDEAVRVAAIAALSVLGSEADIPLLVRLAVSGRSPTDREAASAALGFLPGASVNGEIIAQVADVDAAERATLVKALGERNATEAADVLLRAAVDPDRVVRAESQKSLAIVTGPERIDELIELLIAEQDSAVRNEAERTVVYVAEKAPEDSSRSGPVLAMLPSVTDSAARGSLIEVLGRIGDPVALPAIRAALEDADSEYRQAAIAALGSWPDAGPAPELLNVVRTTDDRTTRVLALRAYIDLLRIRSERPVQESIDLFVGAMNLATETSEKRMALAGLGDLGTAEAMSVTVAYIDDPTLKPEAEAALLNLLNRVRGADDEQARQLLDAGLRQTLTKIVAVAENERLRERAAEMLERGR